MFSKVNRLKQGFLNYDIHTKNWYRNRTYRNLYKKYRRAENRTLLELGTHSGRELLVGQCIPPN